MNVLITAEQIRRRVADLAAEIRGDYDGRPLTLVGVLTGSIMFVADLVRQLAPSTRVAFVHASSYRGQTTQPGALEIRTDLLGDLSGREVLILDDILDTGRTLAAVIRKVEDGRPASIRVAVLLRKRGRQQVPIEPDYCGFEIPNVFVVGYGLDYNDEYRQLPYVGVLS